MHFELFVREFPRNTLASRKTCVGKIERNFSTTFVRQSEMENQNSEKGKFL